MAERDLVKSILVEFRGRGAYAVKIHGGPYQPRSIDILACYRGRFVGLEVKDGPNKHATPIQLAVLDQINTAGGLGYTVHSLQEAIAVLDRLNFYG